MVVVVGWRRSPECDVIDLSGEEEHEEKSSAGCSSMALNMLTDKIKDLEDKVEREREETRKEWVVCGGDGDVCVCVCVCAVPRCSARAPARSPRSWSGTMSGCRPRMRR